MKKVTKIAETAKSKDKLHKIRVAAYCRVSTGSDAQLESLETQKSHYESYIRLHSDWIFAGLYYDEGITGTKKDKRPELMRMISDCEAGKIDYIVTKSISRFSRNTTDCLELVRKLLKLHIPIYFEKENINTATMESELFLSILSSMAEDESYSISQNMKWSARKRFENGTFKVVYPPYGYEWNGEQMVVNPKQAEVVQFIFNEALKGTGSDTIADLLNDKGIPARNGRAWRRSTVHCVLSNEKYTGDCIFQKTWTDSSFKRHINRGEKDAILVKDHHEPIISREDWDNVQRLIRQRSQEKSIEKDNQKYLKRYTFTGKILCGCCGSTFKRRIAYSSSGSPVIWVCKTHLQGKTKCPMQSIKDEDLKRLFLTMMNKLIYSYRLILRPYANSLKDNARKETLDQIDALKGQLSENARKRQTLTHLMTQGIIDQTLYSRETAELLAASDGIRKEIDFLENTASNVTEVLLKTRALLHFAEKSEMLQEFDGELFNEFVDHITVHSRHEITFCLKCGLELKERM